MSGAGRCDERFQQIAAHPSMMEHDERCAVGPVRIVGPDVFEIGTEGMHEIKLGSAQRNPRGSLKMGILSHVDPDCSPLQA